MAILRVPALVLLATSAMLTGCDEMDWGSSDRFKEDFRYNFEQGPGGRLSVENLNGPVEIVGHDSSQVEITGTKYANTEELLKAVKIDVVNADNAIRVRTVSPSGHRRGGHGARYLIRVPRRTELERIASSNGQIRVENVEGKGRLRTSNGAVRVVQMRGAIDVETSNGPIEIQRQEGDVVARTSNGSIRAEEVRGMFEATTSNGSIDARIADPKQGSPVKMESSNGHVRLRMDRLDGNDVRMTTSNSSVTLELPAAVNAQVRAHTSNSSIDSDFSVSADGGRSSKGHLEGRIGSGGPTLDLQSSNGKITLQRL